MAVSLSKQVGADIDRLEADFEADPGNFVPLAKAYLERNLPLQAIKVCKEGLKHNPNAPKGLLALGMAYYHAFDDEKAESVLKKVTKQSPDEAAAHRALGEIYLARGQEQKAIEYLHRAFELQPADEHTRSLLLGLGEKVSRAATGRESDEDIWPARTTPPVQEPAKSTVGLVAQIAAVAVVMVLVILWYRHHVQVQLQIENYQEEARKLIRTANFDKLLEAEKQLESAFELDDDNTRTVVKMAWVKGVLWTWHGLADRKNKLAELSAWMEEEQLPNPERFYASSLLKISEGKAQEAEKSLDDVVERAIKEKDIFLDASVFGARAIAKLRQGKLAAAREDFSRAAKFTGDSPHYQSLFADVYLREGNLQRAIRYFKDALRRNPAHTFSNLRLAYAIILNGKKVDAAKKIIEEFLDPQRHPEAEFSAPLNSLRYQVRGELALFENDPAEAAKWAAKAVEAYDASAEAHGLAGRVAALNKDAARATAEFEKALKLDPYLPKLYFDRAEAMYALGDAAGAIEKLREYERHLKPTVAYHVVAGRLMMRAGNLDAALEEFKKAVKVDELSPDARFHVALCYKAMGERLGSDKKNKDKKLELYNQARKWFEETLMLPGGERGEVYHEMGRIYLDSEDPDNAMDALGKAALAMQKAGDPPSKIAVVYEDVARVFDYLGGPEGKKQAAIYRIKAKGLREGKTMEQVEKEAQEQLKKQKKKKRRRSRRQRRR